MGIGGLLVEEPALDRSEGNVSRDRLLRRGRRRAGLRRSRGDGRLGEGGEPGDGRVLEELARGDAAARLARPRHHLERQDRVAAEGEEVVVDPHSRQPQHLGPDAGEELLDRAARGGGLGRPGARSGRFLLAVERRESPAVELAVGGERQGVETHERRRQHRLGKRLGEMGAQVGGLPLRARRDVGDEPAHAAALAHRDRRGAHAGAGGEGGLDLPQLDAMTADLDLPVGAAEELELAVRPPARQVAGAVETGSRLAGGEPIGQEALGGQLRAAQIAAGEPGAADVDLPRDAERHQAAVEVEQVDLEIGERAADRARRRLEVGRAHRPPGDVDRRLGDAVHVDQARAGLPEAADPAGERGRVERLAAEDHQAQVRQIGAPAPIPESGRRQLGERRGGLAQHRHPLGREQPQEILRRPAHRVGHHHQPAAVGERSPHLPHREIEGVGVEEGPHVAGAEAEQRRGRGEQPRDIGMGDRDTLRASGRARGVEDVGEVLGPGSRSVRALPGLGAIGRRIGRHQDRRVRRQCRRELGAGDEHPRPRVVEHEGEPLRRIGRIERHVGAAGLEHREEDDDQIERALQADRDERLRSYAATPQHRGEAGGARRELAVGELPFPFRPGQGDGSRRPRRLGGEAPVETGALERGPWRARRVPLRRELPALGRRQHREVAEPAARRQPIAQGREEVRPVGEQARRGRRVVAGGIAGEAEDELLPRRRGDRRQRVVRPLAEAHLAERHASLRSQRDGRVVLEDEEGGDQGGAGRQLAPALDTGERRRLERLEGELAVLQGGEPGADLRPRPEPHAHRQRVDEEADHRLDAGERDAAPGDRGAEDDVVRRPALSGIAPEEGRPCPLDEGAQGQPVAPRGVREAGVRSGVEREPAVLWLGRRAGFPLDPRGAFRAGGRAGRADLGRRGEAGELAAEEGLRGGEVLAAQPGDVVAVRARRGEGEVAAGGEGAIEAEHLGEEERQRPAVEEQVVRGPDQAMAGGAEAQERQAEERRARRLEALPAVGGQEGREARRALGRGEAAPVLGAERQLDLPLHRLERSLLALPDERRAQHGVALDHPLPGAREGRLVERPGERAAQLLDVEPRLGGVEAVEEHPLLERGEGVDVFEVPRGHRLLKVSLPRLKRAAASYLSASGDAGRAARAPRHHA